MQNYRRYKKSDYTGFLGPFIASWTLHGILFALAATTTVFYPPTADREMISVDLLFASPVSGAPEVLPQKLTHSSPPPTEEQEAIEDSEPGAAEPLKAPISEVSSDSQALDLMTIIAPKPEEKMIPAATLPPARVNHPKINKVIKLPPMPQTIVQGMEKAPKIEPKPKEVMPVAAESAPPPILAVQTKTFEQSEQDRIAVENETVLRLQEAELRAANERAQEEARAVSIAKKAEMERLTAEKVNQQRAAAENERIRRLQELEQNATIEKARKAAREAKLAKAAELEKQKAEKAAKARMAAEKAKLERATAEKARREQVARLKREEETAAKEKLARERAEVEKVARERIPQARLIANSKNALPFKPTNGSNTVGSVKTEGAAIAAVVPPVKPLIASTTTNTENNQPNNKTEQKGLALPPVIGDIKLIITAEDDLIVKVLFVSHPKARHDKPLSKKEAREQQKITPIVVRSARNILEAVIERSSEGIYIFQLEQKGSKPANGKFSLRLFDSKNKSITSREISGQTEIARLLMPEGILWEDDTAFSGNIEDSDSITKFNSESGLVWKEYRK